MTATQEKAGARLYKEHDPLGATLAHYQMMREGAQRDVAYNACMYLDSKDSKYEVMYTSAKARVGCWDEAIRVLTKNGGHVHRVNHWLRLDFPPVEGAQ